MLLESLYNNNQNLFVYSITSTTTVTTTVITNKPNVSVTPGISILFAKPVKQPPDLFSFMSPLSLDVWVYMATAYMGVSVLLFVLAR